MYEPTNGLRLVLTRAAEGMSPVRVPDDIWGRGLRLRRRRLWGRRLAIGTVAVLLALPFVLAGRGTGEGLPASPARGAVPGEFHRPWPWQPAAVDAPAGPAALLVSGNAGFSMGTFDFSFKSGSVLAVVGANGAYRMLRDASMYVQAGQNMLLSPDGRYVAGQASVEQASGGAAQPSGIVIVDLVTGQVRRMPAPPATRYWTPVAWSPDGASIVVSGPEEYSLLLLDVGTGAIRRLIDLPDPRGIHTVNFVAFAPDGRQVAVAAGARLSVVDTVDGTERRLGNLGERQRLAGPGAWSLDGRRLAVLTFDGCAGACTAAQRNVRSWRLGYLDTATGAAIDGPRLDPLTGAAVRLVGWERSGDAVAVRYIDEVTGEGGYELDGTFYKDVTDIDLVALHPGGGRSTLLKKPANQVWDVDVPRDLVVDGRFGGPSPEPSVFPLPAWMYVVLAFVAAFLAVPPIAAWALRRRRYADRLRSQQRARNGI